MISESFSDSANTSAQDLMIDYTQQYVCEVEGNGEQAKKVVNQLVRVNILNMFL